MLIFLFQLTTSKDGNLTQLVHALLYVMAICVTPAGASTSLTSRRNGMTTHTHIHTLIHAYSTHTSAVDVPVQNSFPFVQELVLYY